MTKKWVVNASPLIILAKISHLHLLEKLSRELVIPGAVSREIRLGPQDDPARIWLKGRGALHIKEAQVDEGVAACLVTADESPLPGLLEDVLEQLDFFVDRGR